MIVGRECVSGDTDIKTSTKCTTKKKTNTINLFVMKLIIYGFHSNIKQTISSGGDLNSL